MKHTLEVLLSVLSYSLCSGLLVLLNKLTLHHMPYPSLVVCVQLLATLLFVYVAKCTKFLHVDELRYEYVIPYLYYVALFSFGVYCNMRSLTISNVETVIVFRALSPCLVAVLDYAFLGRELPSTKSWAGLILIVVGAYSYASFDEKFQTQGWSAYGWPVIYVVVISLEMAYGKKIVNSVDLKTFSGPVLYTNLLSFLPMLSFALMGNEFKKIETDLETGDQIFAPIALILLLLGCIAGTGIGYASWWCRGVVSATSFTLIGVINKCLTVLINFFIWDQHAAPGGILSLLLCLVGGTMYRQAPLRSDAATTLIDKPSSEDTSVESDSDLGDEEKAALMEGEPDRQSV